MGRAGSTMQRSGASSGDRPLETRPLGTPTLETRPLETPLCGPALWRPLSGDPPSGDPPSGDPPLGPCRPLSEQVVRQPRTPLAESPPVTLCCRANRQRRSSLLPSKEAFEAWELGVVAGSLPLMRQ